jgi:formamidopyrimidine-DNA glycosylase
VPELPEVETVRRDVHERVVGRVIDDVLATGMRTVRRSSPRELEDAALGRTVVNTGRHGKWLWLSLDDGACVLVHLRMSGQFRWSPGAETPAPIHTHVTFRFGADELRFVDPRTFGEVIPVASASDAVTLIAQGPDALSISADETVERVARRRRAIKSMLLDQKAIAGVGNIYADEILHRARVRPTASGLTRPAARRVHVAMGEVFASAIAARGSSLADEQYVDLSGQIGSFQHQHRVHARPVCGTCGGSVTRVVLGGRSAYFCRACQPR